MSGETNWLPGVLVAAVGGAAALLFLVRGRRAGLEATAPETVEDLTARYDSVLAQLRDHQTHKHHTPSEAWEAERARLELLAASLLRRRAELTHELEKGAARAERRAARASSSAGRSALAWGLGAAGVGLVALSSGYALSRNARERTDGMGMTGIDPGAGARSDAAPVDPRLAQLHGLVRGAPRDVEAYNSLAAHLLQRQAFGEARPWIFRALAEDAFSVRARVNAAVLAALDGDDALGLAELERLAALYPEAYDARLFAGLLAMDLGDKPRAVRAFEAYLVQAPREERPPELERAIHALLDGERRPPPALPPGAAQTGQ